MNRPPSPLNMLLSKHTRRREFITFLGGAAAAWPLAARAQQPERMRRIGVLIARSANDKEGQAFVAAFLQELQELGWSVGRNVIVDSRWSTGNADAFHLIGLLRLCCHRPSRRANNQSDELAPPCMTGK